MPPVPVKSVHQQQIQSASSAGSMDQHTHAIHQRNARKHSTVPIRAALRVLAGTDGARDFQRREAPSGAHLQARRRPSANLDDPRRALGIDGSARCAPTRQPLDRLRSWALNCKQRRGRNHTAVAPANHVARSSGRPGSADAPVTATGLRKSPERTSHSPFPRVARRYRCHGRWIGPRHSQVTFHEWPSRSGERWLCVGGVHDVQSALTARRQDE